MALQSLAPQHHPQQGSLLIKADCCFIGSLGILCILQIGQSHSQEHVELPHLGLEVDGCAEEMESGRVLLHSQVDKAQIIENLPV